MRIALIGPGNTKFHYQELLKISEEQYKQEVWGIARALVNSNVEIELLPDDGICIELARQYKREGGRKVIASLPLSDKTFGVNHLKEYADAKVNGKNLLDEIIDTDNWFKHDLIKGLMGNAILYLGASPGTDGERHYAIYLYKLIAGFKKGVEVSASAIHPEARAGKNFSILVYSPFLIAKKLPKEDEEYMKRFGVSLIYVRNARDLEKKLKKLNN